MKQKITRQGIRLFAILSVVLLFSAYRNNGPATSGHPATTPEKGKPQTTQDLQTIRKRIIDDLLQGPVDAGKITKLIQSIQPDGSWPGINYKDTTKTGFQHSIHLENMLQLARAYKKKGTEFYMNPAAKKTVSSALDFWIAHDFICENWWWNEMGTPNSMINTLLLLDQDLTPRQRTEGARIAGRASLSGFGARAGGDFVPIAGMVCKQGLFKDNDSILQHALKVMMDQIVVTPARGINPDMGFHHRVDNVTSIHTYGTNYVSSFAYWAVKTAGTKYALPEKSLTLLIDYYIDGISKCMAYGIYPDPGAKNRDLSREGSLDPAGTELPENLLQASSYRKGELEYLIQVRKGLKKPTLTWNRYFWHSSYGSSQRANYYASFRMYSSRQNNVEEAYNEEGLKNHHLADGSNFLSRTGREYVDVFPVWDWQKIPGTTVVQRPALPPAKEIPKKGLTDFVGAVSDGQFGAAAFDFRSVHDPLSGRKAWFFFDKEYVCLGSAISSSAEYPVATTVNQCLLHNEVVVKTANGEQTLQKGSRSMEGVSWVWHDSVTYLFPAPAAVYIGNEQATGNWRQITHQAWATEAPVQKDLFTLWFDHGRQPRSASYAYIVVPGSAKSGAEQYSKQNGIEILANTPALQAVQNKNLHLSEAVFYQPGTISLSDNIKLTAKQPCIVLVNTAGTAIKKIAVCDPTQKLTSVQLQITAPVAMQAEGFSASWNKDSRTSDINVNLPSGGEAGKSVVAEAGKK
ncbi:MAG: chondroitin lyase [Williamsia sp.]|nr:chondroitin lyase [Williamsia sp.]